MSRITRSLFALTFAAAALAGPATVHAAPQTSPIPSSSAVPLAVAAPTQAGDPAAARAAADHVVGQLVDGHVEEDTGGVTADVVLSLVAVGGYEGEVAAATDWLEEQATTYAEGNGPAAGKLAVVAAATGGDPADFGGLDLVGEVESAVLPDGQCGDSGDAFSQSLCVLGLARAGADVEPEVVDFLVALQDESGAFGFESDGAFSADNDTTGLALAALAGAVESPGATESATAARDYLLDAQHDDGHWDGFAPANTAGLVGPALQLVGEDVGSATSWLAAQQLDDGGLPNVLDGTESDLMATVQGTMLLAGESLLSVGEGGTDRVDLGGATAGDCAPDSGVLVVVDPGEGEPATGCAPGDPVTGEDATTAAGFAIEHSPSGLVCQVEGHPGDCPTSPPFDAYWSFWYAEPTADGEYEEWVMAPVGAGEFDPAPGTVQGWRFGGGGEEPPAWEGIGAAPGPPADDDADTSSPGGGAGGDGAGDTAAATSEAPAGGSDAAAGTAAPDAAAADTDDPDGSGPVTTLLVVAGLVLLALAVAGWSWWRRRTS